jgi:hypothetical protein
VALPSKERLPRGPVLYQEKIRMIFKEDIIINSKIMNGHKVLCGLRNMQNLFEFKVSIMGINSSFTNMTNVHTCTVCCMNLFATMVLLVKR